MAIFTPPFELTPRNYRDGYYEYRRLIRLFPSRIALITRVFNQFIYEVFNVFPVAGSVVSSKGVKLGSGPRVVGSVSGPLGGFLPITTSTWTYLPPDPPEAAVPATPAVEPPFVDTRQLENADTWLPALPQTVALPYVYTPEQAEFMAKRTYEDLKALENSRLITVPWRYPLVMGQLIRLQQTGYEDYIGRVKSIEVNQTGKQQTRTVLLVEAKPLPDQEVINL